MVADRRLQPLASSRIEGGGMAAAMRPGVQVAGLLLAPPEAGEEGQADAEGASDLTPGALVVLDGGGDPFAQVQGLGLHNASSPRKGLLSPSLILGCRRTKSKPL